MDYKEKIFEDLKSKGCEVFKPMYDVLFDFVILYKNKTYDVSLIELEEFRDLEFKNCDFLIILIKSTNEIIYTNDLFNHLGSKNRLNHFDSNVYVTGPYINGDKRKYVRYVFSSKKQKLTLYSRYLMEQKLKRYLTEDETVDHIDRNKHNDLIGNLQVLEFSKHIELDSKRVRRLEIKCVWCDNKVIRSPRDLSNRAKQGMAGPFCSKKCSGEYGSSLQNKRIEKLPLQSNIPVEEREYYYLDKM